VIQRQKDGYAVECEACGEADETYDVRSFSDAWNLFKSLGWRAHNTSDAWTHKCPACAKERRVAREMFGSARK
jgi:hypothetical protein